VELVVVETEEEAKRQRFYGSPTVLHRWRRCCTSRARCGPRARLSRLPYRSRSPYTHPTSRGDHRGLASPSCAAPTDR
jgi:hypothetical protein